MSDSFYPAAVMPGPGEPANLPALAALLEHVRATVTSYVGRRREAGTSVRCVLPDVKALVREAVSGDADLGPGVADLLMPWAVRWSFEAYDPPRTVTRGVPSGHGRARRSA